MGVSTEPGIDEFGVIPLVIAFVGLLRYSMSERFFPRRLYPAAAVASSVALYALFVGAFSADVLKTGFILGLAASGTFSAVAKPALEDFGAKTMPGKLRDAIDRVSGAAHVGASQAH
jgi:hypothetical protein